MLQASCCMVEPTREPRFRSRFVGKVEGRVVAGYPRVDFEKVDWLFFDHTTVFLRLVRRPVRVKSSLVRMPAMPSVGAYANECVVLVHVLCFMCSIANHPNIIPLIIVKVLCEWDRTRSSRTTKEVN